MDAVVENFKLEVALSRAEIARYNLYHIRWLIIADIIGLGIFLYLILVSLYHPAPETRDLFESILIWAAIALAVGLSQPLIIILQIFVFNSKSVKLLMARRYYSFSDEGIAVQSSGKKAKKSWNDIIDVRNIGNMMLLFTTPKLAYLLPRRCFESQDDWRFFSRFLSDKIKKTRP